MGPPRGYLTEREGELTEIEQGNNLPEFNIVAPSTGEPTSNGAAEDIPLDEDSFLAKRTRDPEPAAGGQRKSPSRERLVQPLAGAAHVAGARGLECSPVRM